MKHYLVTALNAVRGHKRWLSMVPKLGPEVTPVIAMYKPYFEPPQGSIVIKQDKEFPKNPVESRFFDFRYAPLRGFIGSQPDEWFLISDATDVAYQRPLPKPPEDAYGCFCSAGTTFGKGPYWQHIFEGPFRDYRNVTILSGGLFLIRGGQFIEYLDLVKKMSGKINETVDTICVAEYVRRHPLGAYVWNDVFLNLYDRLRECDVKGRVFVNRKTKKPYSVVHAPGGTRKILDTACPIK